ncbi:FAD-dependent oxidoreductase [Ramlibacter sp. XY19]|uniref:FAD-dependent oxidoreductase n=1 Tax=Ramlibacter paludis TaxID=2908000 RepID=UPI0023DC6E0A|nr:FAD-dependent oxidoreductase [Ramlibacter paludis]MCG2594683.1 FAD-dependent oxidoreductase [Ramlibacter paludis]
MGQGHQLTRRGALLAGAAALAGCTPAVPEAPGAFAGASAARGHLLRDLQSAPAPAVSRRADVVIAGAGIAGLAAARALRRRDVEDFVLLELEDTAGGNSRGSELQGIACPLGAHYLPVPGDNAREVQELLEELGLRRRVAGRWEYDERHLCHAPQERLFFEGAWQEGLLPLSGVGASTLAQYLKFAGEVEQARKGGGFQIPEQARAKLLGWDGETFAAWLDRRGLTDPQLRWYLDYCCRDDFGAGAATVAAWAGLHYFAARHGFHPPGAEGGDREALLTWPQGNGWLAQALAAPLGDRMRGGQVVLRIAEQAHGIEVDALDVKAQRVERWLAQKCIVALPVLVAARVVENAPGPLRALAARTRYAPWIVANLHLRAPLADRRGMPKAWDNVVYGSEGLGYVVATHQDLNPAPGPTVLSWYCAPGEAARADLLQKPWTHWRDRALAELSVPHPDLPHKLTQVQVARYGHAMSVPVPGALSALPAPPDTQRMRYAHADWAGYSIFEEAFTLGQRAGAR